MHGTISGRHGGVYSRQRDLVTIVADICVLLAAGLTAASMADDEQMQTLLPELPAALCLGLGDQHDHTLASNAA